MIVYSAAADLLAQGETGNVAANRLEFLAGPLCCLWNKLSYRCFSWTDCGQHRGIGKTAPFQQRLALNSILFVFL